MFTSSAKSCQNESFELLAVVEREVAQNLQKIAPTLTCRFYTV